MDRGQNEPLSRTARPRPSASPPSASRPGRGSGSSNSRCGVSSDRNPGRPKLPPPSPRQWRKVLAAHDDGRISATEAEVLVGYLWMASLGVIGERTDRRRRARFRELDIPVCEGIDLLAWQLAQRILAGELSYADAERQLGRVALVEARERVSQRP
jgi:hypothetical protein